jgi:hypothetical protein
MMNKTGKRKSMGSYPHLGKRNFRWGLKKKKQDFTHRSSLDSLEFTFSSYDIFPLSTERFTACGS